MLPAERTEAAGWKVAPTGSPVHSTTLGELFVTLCAANVRSGKPSNSVSSSTSPLSKLGAVVPGLCKNALPEEKTTPEEKPKLVLMNGEGVPMAPSDVDPALANHVEKFWVTIPRRMPLQLPLTLTLHVCVPELKPRFALTLTQVPGHITVDPLPCTIAFP